MKKNSHRVAMTLEQLRKECQVINQEEARSYVGGNGVYAVFQRQSGKLMIYDDNGTPDFKDDDILLHQADAHNYVGYGANQNNPKKHWPTGIYPMLDQTGGHMHGNGVDKKGIGLDTPNGAYGESGIYRAEPFYHQEAKRIRSGMGIHSGRNDLPFDRRITQGCIRVEQDTMDVLDRLIEEEGNRFTHIEVQD